MMVLTVQLKVVHKNCVAAEDSIEDSAEDSIEINNINFLFIIKYFIIIIV